MKAAGILLLKTVLCFVWASLVSWGALALWFRAPMGAIFQAALPAAWLLCAVGLMAMLVKGRMGPALTGMAATSIALFAWWNSLQPRGQADWSRDVARTSTAEIDGDSLRVSNVRNFRWRSNIDFDERWEEREYRLSNVSGADLFLSYWAGESIAHAVVSFGFEDGRRLAWSIEVRKLRAEEYSAFAGFFRQNEVAMIAADEQDVVKVRATVRGEDVRLYRLDIRPETARRLLMAYAAEANEVAARPRFYNTLTTNCTTIVYRLASLLDPGIPLDFRIILSGYLPGYLYEHDFLERSMPLSEIVRRASISEKAVGPANDPGFSDRIRLDIPSPR